MNNEKREQQLDQLLRGIYRMCVTRNECSGCPVYSPKCTFDEPRPSTWFDEETIKIPVLFVAEEKEAVKTPDQPKEPAENMPEIPKVADDETGTWLVSTTMGSMFTKYVFICSKCGYKKESLFSITPTSLCPECEKRKNNPDKPE